MTQRARSVTVGPFGIEGLPYWWAATYNHLAMKEFQMLFWTEKGAASAYSILRGLTRARDVRSDIARTHAHVLDALPSLLSNARTHGARILNGAADAERLPNGAWEFAGYESRQGGGQQSVLTIVSACRNVYARDMGLDSDAVFCVTQERIYLLLPTNRERVMP